MSTSRRGFLGWLGSASLLGAVGAPSLVQAESRARIGAAPDGHVLSVAETWEMSWTSRVTGKYKAVFDSPAASDGAALFRAVAWTEQYKEVYNVDRSDLSTVVVLRHLGFYFAMNDEFWDRYEVGRELKMRDKDGKKWAKVNPLGPTADADEKTRKYGLADFQKAGGIVLVCGWSFGGAASQIAKKENLDKDAARAKAKELLLPGMILQPNGVFAALRAQEAGCSYIDAS